MPLLPGQRRMLELVVTVALIAIGAGFFSRGPTTPIPSARALPTVRTAEILHPLVEEINIHNEQMLDLCANETATVEWQIQHTKGDTAFAEGDYARAKALYLCALELAMKARDEQEDRYEKWSHDGDFGEVIWRAGQDGNYAVHRTLASLGKVYYRLGNYGLSAFSLESAAELAMGAFDARYHLEQGRALVALGRHEEAAFALAESWYWYEECYPRLSHEVARELADLAELLAIVGETEVSAAVENHIQNSGKPDQARVLRDRRSSFVFRERMRAKSR